VIQHCLVPAIGQMYGCITTGSGRPYSEVVVGADTKKLIVLTVKMIKVMSEQNDNKTKWLHLRLSVEEYTKIQKNFSKTTCLKISEYARKILLNKPITGTYRNQSLDDFMAEMIKLRSEMNSLGNNFNQAVKKLNTLQQIAEFRSWIITYELEKKILFNKVDEIKNRINKIADQWLQ